jgi:hypothetical protein
MRPQPPELSPTPMQDSLHQTAVGTVRHLTSVLVWAGIVYVVGGWWPGFARVLFWGVAVLLTLRLLHTLLIGIVLPLALVPFAAITGNREMVRAGEAGFLLLGALIRIVDFSVVVACLATLYHRLYG